MDRNSLVLTALSPAKGAPHSPVQVQKLLFLIDRNIAQEVGGPHFNFLPYAYGPFDLAVYTTLEELEKHGLVSIDEAAGRKWKMYCLTPEGQKAGEECLKKLDDKIALYVSTLSGFVRQLSFAQLVSAVYKAYPEMKVNSVFKE
jgi:hypothetical protein